MPRLLGGLCAATTAGSSNSKLDAHACSREHVDEHVDAEQIDLATNKIAYPWLGDSKEIRCRALRQFARLNKPPDFHHQLRAKPQALSLLRSKAQVSEHVPGRLLNFHVSLTGAPPLQQIAQSRFGELQIILSGLSALFLECMNHVGSFFKLCDVKDPVL
jgi:hypothetical protein